MYVKKGVSYLRTSLKKLVPLWARDGISEWGYYPTVWWLEQDDRETLTKYLSDPGNFKAVSEIYEEIERRLPSTAWDAHARLKELQGNIAEKTEVPRSVVERNLKESYHNLACPDEDYWK